MDSSRVATKSSRAITLTGVLGLWLAIGPGCGGDTLDTSVSFRAIGPPNPVDGRCPTSSVPVPAFPDGGADLVRLTISAGNALVCDAVLDRDQGDRVIAIPSDSGDLVDLHIEYFRGAPGTAALVGSGRRHNVNLGYGTTIDVPITPANQFACAAAPAGIARVFHSATVLPTGEVLLLGGAVASASGTPAVDLSGDGLLYATAEVEMYDPNTRRFQLVSIPGLLPRVLHRAVIVAADDASVDIALVGGLTVSGDAAITPVLAISRTGRVVLPATAEAIGAPLEILHYDLTTSAMTTTLIDQESGPTARVFGASSGDCGGMVAVAGGWTDATAQDPISSFEVVSPSGSAVTEGVLPISRIGATSQCLDHGQALLWGGQLDSDDAELEGTAGELLSGLDSATPIAITPSFSGTPPTARAFSELIHTGDGDLMVVGGFVIAQHQAVAPDPILAQLLTVGATIGVANISLSEGGAPEGAGFASTAPLADGDVLVSGGTPESCSAKLVCSLGASYRFRDTSDQLEPITPLIVDRYGHRTCLLADGTVLVTGGLHAGTGSLEVLADAELFDARETADDPLAAIAPTLSRQPGDIARDSDGVAVAECIDLGQTAGEVSQDMKLHFHILP